MKNSLIINKQFLTLLALILFLAGCKKENNDNTPGNQTNTFNKGVFIVNEGSFTSGTGTITHLNRTGDTVTQDVFRSSNDGEVLGNIVQSMNSSSEDPGKAFVVVSNADKVEVVDLKTFKRLRTISNVSGPRYVEFGNNGRAYVSCWDNRVKIFDLQDSGLLGELPTGMGPEKMLRVDNSIWVLNQGGFSIDSTITVISTETDEVVKTVQVYPKPSGIQRDASGFVWVLCAGQGWNGFPDETDTKAHLLCIDPADFKTVIDIPFPTSTEHPDDLVINVAGDRLFYSFVDGIYGFDTHGSALEEEPFVPSDVMYYGLGVDPEEDILYASDPLDYQQAGIVYRFYAKTGVAIDFIQAGIIPGEFFFTRETK